MSLQSWIDSHCHLSDQRFAASRTEVLQRSRRAGVGAWVLGGTHPEDWAAQEDLLSQQGSNIRISAGIHPWWVSSKDPDELNRWMLLLEQKLSDRTIHAFGELGLHYTPRFTQEEQGKQKIFFERQLDLARKYPVYPLILHVVRAHSEAIHLLQALGTWPQGGIVHSFAGEQAEAQAYLELGFFLSFSASTRMSPQRKRWMSQLPLNRILLETDAPDQAPPELRAQGKNNEPAFLPLVAEMLAPLFDRQAEDLLNISSQNARSLFWSTSG